jgi:hypothetical protein
MQLKHKKPCAECPWRKVAPQGWLGGEAARRVVGRNNDCFPHLMAFYEYHAGKPYVHPILRDNQETL